jgi:hypothetical protein
MVASGRLTEEEADRLRGADESGQFDSAIRGIRVRHAGAKLAAAIEDGSLSQEDADVILNRLRSGEHSAAIRAHLRSLLPKGRSRSRRSGRVQPGVERDADIPA